MNPLPHLTSSLLVNPAPALFLANPAQAAPSQLNPALALGDVTLAQAHLGDAIPALAPKTALKATPATALSIHRSALPAPAPPALATATHAALVSAN